MSSEKLAFERSIGKWNIWAKPYASDNTCYFGATVYTLYMRRNQHNYVLEIVEKDFSHRPILPGENVSLEGTWQGMDDLQVKLANKQGVYVGTLLSVLHYEVRCCLIEMQVVH